MLLRFASAGLLCLLCACGGPATGAACNAGDTASCSCGSMTGRRECNDQGHWTACFWNTLSCNRCDDGNGNFQDYLCPAGYTCTPAVLSTGGYCTRSSDTSQQQIDWVSMCASTNPTNRSYCE